jgi:hypothetical protein
MNAHSIVHRWLHAKVIRVLANVGWMTSASVISIINFALASQTTMIQCVQCMYICFGMPNNILCAHHIAGLVFTIVIIVLLVFPNCGG